MGRELAAVALAIVSSKEAEHFRTSPCHDQCGYFHGMVAKAIAGELYFERTVWALRGAITPERQAGRAGGSDRRDIKVLVKACMAMLHHARPFAAAGRWASIGGLPTVHSVASGVRPEAFRPRTVPAVSPTFGRRGLPRREIPHRRHAPPLPKPRTLSGR